MYARTCAIYNMYNSIYILYSFIIGGPASAPFKRSIFPSGLFLGATINQVRIVTSRD